jgi:hypothetical protein
MLMRDTIPAARPAFALIAIAALLLGLFLFFWPGAVATLPAPANSGNPWPWPIGPLAVRFVGSALIALAVSAALVARRPDRPTILAFAIGVAIGGAWFLLHLVVNAGRIDWGRPLAYAWAGTLGAGWVASLLAASLLWQQAPHGAALPATPPPARWIPVFIGVLTGMVGIMMFFLPDTGRARWPWDLANAINVQLFGALFLTVSTAAFWSWRQPSWYGYDALYPGAGTFSLVALIAALLHWPLFEGHPLAKWLFVAVYLLGAALGYYPFARYGARRLAYGQ